MATITLSGTSLNYGMGINAFGGLGSAFSNAKKTANGLHEALGSLRSKINTASPAGDVSTSETQAQKAQTRESEKNGSLSVAYDKLDTLISDVGDVDNKASEKIGEREDDFYKEYSYLKPECKKSKKEKIKDWCAARINDLKDGFSDLLDAVGDFIGDVFEWCKEHWKELVIGLVFIVVGALITVFTAGAGTAFWAAFGAALLKGAAMAAISAAIGGAVSAGCTYYQCRKAGLSPELSFKYAKRAFGDGAASGFMTGGIGFAVGAGVIGVVGKGALVGHSLWGSVGKGALFGAGTNAVTAPAATALSYWLKNGTLEGSGDAVIRSTISGIISGAIFGGITGGAQYKIAENRISSIEQTIADRTDLKPTQQGKLYESEMIGEFNERFPDSNYASQCRLNSNSLINRAGKPSYSMPDLLVENGNSGSFTNYDFKWNNAGRTFNQNVLTGGGGGFHVMDTTVTGSNLPFSTNTVPAGTPFIEVHPGSFNSIFGVPLDWHSVLGGSFGVPAGVGASD